MKFRHVLLFALTIALLVGCSNAKKKEAESAEHAQEAETAPLVDVAANPADYVDKVIELEGIVEARCQGKGCWISLITDGMDEGLIVTTPDESYVFPEDVVGKTVKVSGTWILKNADQIAAHEAESEGADHACPNPVYYLHIDSMEEAATADEASTEA
jgi:hypothetical protein